MIRLNWSIIMTLIMLVFVSCKSKTEITQQTVTVKIGTVQIFGKKLEATFPGKVKAASDVNIAFRVSGTILHMKAKEGTFVRKGELLAEMDPRDYKIQLSATEAEYKQIKGDAERLIQLYEQKSISQSDYDKAVYGLQQIEAKYNAHKNELKDTRLCAPFDGYIQKIYFDENETVSAGMPIVSLINTQSFEVEINIPTSEYVRRNEVDSYSCSVDIYPDIVYPLELIGLNQKANLNQLYTVRLRINADKGVTLPTAGMATTVKISYKSQESLLTLIPLSAVFQKDGNSSVWVYDSQNKNVTARDVDILEIHNDGMVVVSKGLKANETIITAGVHSLSDGQVVDVLPEITDTNVGGLL